MKKVLLYTALICAVIGANAYAKAWQARKGNAQEERVKALEELPVCGVPKRALVHTMQQYRALKKEAIEMGRLAKRVMTLPKKSFPVLTAKFADSGEDDWPVSLMQQQLFDGPWPTGTMREYFLDMSYGQFTLDGTVYGWYQVAHEQAYYSTHGINFDNPHTKEFLREVLDSEDGAIDFTQYDNDGPDGLPNSGDDDGYVDTIFFISAGQQNSENIWPHFYTYSLFFGEAYETNDIGTNGLRIKIDDYIFVNALRSYSTEMTGIGVFCHEFGHALGLPDLYDIDESSVGIGCWGVMGFPDVVNGKIGMTAWSKAHLGWIVPEIVPIGETLKKTIQDSYRNPEAYILWRKSEPQDEYFLIENRQKIGFDENIPGTGLLIWHVDDAKFSFGIGGIGWDNSGNADDNHRGVDLLEADGEEGWGDYGDPFPGRTENHRFDHNSTPNSRDYQRNDTGAAVTNIFQAGAKITADLKISANLLTSIISFPVYETFYSAGDEIPIHGTAVATNFEKYILEYGEGLKPSDWIHIATSTTPVQDTSLGIWNTTLIRKSDFYALRLTVYDSTDFAVDITRVHIATDYQAGWPVTVKERITAPSVAVGDLDGDGNLEIVAGDSHVEGSSLNLYVLERNGKFKPGWPREIFGNKVSAPALADLDQDGDIEIIVATGTSGKVYAFHHDGSSVTGWPRNIGTFASPAVHDLDGDGRLEVVIPDRGANQVHVFNADGTEKAGWPQTRGESSGFISTAVLADITGDSKVDVLVKDQHARVFVWHHDGQPVAGWPVAEASVMLDPYTSPPVVGDINNDGTMEIVSNTPWQIYAFTQEGKIIDGWPVSLELRMQEVKLSLGDIDRDGITDVVAFGKDNLYVFNGRGELLPGWPVKAKTEITRVPIYATTSLQVSEPIIGDINGDRKPDIVVANDLQIYAFNGFGELLEGWPKALPLPPFLKQKTNSRWVVSSDYSPALTDIDKDSDVDVVLAAEDYILIWDLPASYRISSMEWPSWQGNSWRTGQYGFKAPERNSPPQMIALPDTSFPNNVTLEIALDNFVYDFNDPDSSLKWSAAGNDSIKVDIDPHTRIARFSAPNFVGTATIVLTVADPHSTTDSDTMLVTAIPNQPPTAFSLIEPSNGDTVFITNPVLSWESAIDPGDSISYALYYSLDSIFVNATTVRDIATNSYPLHNLQDHRLYFWKIEASDSKGASTFSTVSCFFTFASPSLFKLLSPAFGDTVAADKLLFIWQPAFDPNPADTIRYTLSCDTSRHLVNPITVVGIFDTAFAFTDSLANNTRYFWTVVAVDKDSFVTASLDTFAFWVQYRTTGVDDFDKPTLPKEYALGQNYPNPFNPETAIQYQLPKQVEVRLEIYNLLGELVKTLVDEKQPAEYYTVRWNGKDEHDRPVASGVYLYRLAVGEFVQVRKMILVR